MSKNQDEMIRVLTESGRHMTAEELFMECKSRKISISLATIYRNLGILVEQGALRKISIAGESDRYDFNLSNHDHIICEKCKQVRDIQLGDFTRQIEEKLGSSILSYELNIRYICPDCMTGKEN